MGGWLCMPLEIGLGIIAACAAVILKPGWIQVLLYKCTGTPKQLMCTEAGINSRVTVPSKVHASQD